MEKVLRYRSLEAFCRQRAQMTGEGADVWLEKANILASLAAAESRLEVSAADQENSLRLTGGNAMVSRSGMLRVLNRADPLFNAELPVGKASPAKQRVPE